MTDLKQDDGRESTFGELAGDAARTLLDAELAQRRLEIDVSFVGELEFGLDGVSASGSEAP